MSEYIVDYRWLRSRIFGQVEHLTDGLTEIIRCRDCYHRAGDEADQDGIDPYLCFVHEEYMAPDYFCADGERRAEQ